jgi:hypothetical protein
MSGYRELSHCLKLSGISSQTTSLFRSSDMTRSIGLGDGDKSASEADVWMFSHCPNLSWLSSQTNSLPPSSNMTRSSMRPRKRTLIPLSSAVLTRSHEPSYSSRRLGSSMASLAAFPESQVNTELKPICPSKKTIASILEKKQELIEKAKTTEKEKGILQRIGDARDEDRLMDLFFGLMTELILF